MSDCLELMQLDSPCITHTKIKITKIILLQQIQRGVASAQGRQMIPTWPASCQSCQSAFGHSCCSSAMQYCQVLTVIHQADGSSVPEHAAMPLLELTSTGPSSMVLQNVHAYVSKPSAGVHVVRRLPSQTLISI